MALQIQHLVFNMFQENTYVVWDDNTLEAMIVDPGMIDISERQALDRLISENGLHPKYLVNTHLHLDHTFGDDYVMSKYDLPLMAHESDALLGQNREAQVRSFGVKLNITPLKIDNPLNEGDTLTLGSHELKILHVPGHSPGSIVLYAADANMIIVGDVLFRFSIGRTDLPMGSYEQLITGIQHKLMTLPDDTVVYPGHGPTTTIVEERNMNPYI